MPTAIEEDLARRQAFELQHDRTVRDEIETFRQKADSFLAGDITEDAFRPFRLKHGIYGQRQAGVQMVRCKIPGGLLTAAQVDRLGQIADEFGGGRGHLTTRQNIQYHFVPLNRVPDLMYQLAEVGLTNREACYNTVRNVTVCDWAGVARDEVFDVRPYAQRVAYALLRKDLTGNLPRKFKLAFDGCAGHDCIQGAINDIGLRAVVRDGRRGFRMIIGGGLGPMPVEAQLLDEFVPVERLLNKCEAVIRVFNQYGNRKNKNTARMKFVLRERGIAWMKEQIEKEYQDILANGGIAWPEIVPEGCERNPPKPSGTISGHAIPPLARMSWYSFSICSFIQAMPRSRSTNFMRAVFLFLRLPYWLKTRITASHLFSRRSTGTNSSRSCASTGIGPRPPPMIMRNPRRPSRTTARSPISLMAPWMQSWPAHPSKASLNLRGRLPVRSLRRSA